MAKNACSAVLDCIYADHYSKLEEKKLDAA